MNIEAFLICDAATDQNGKLNVLGAFDSIRAQKFPVVHPHCTVALRLRFYSEENGAHQLEVRLLDDDAHPVIPRLEGHLQVNVAASQQSVAANFILNIQNIHFPHPGDYSVNLDVDGQEIGVLPLTIQAAP